MDKETKFALYERFNSINSIDQSLFGQFDVKRGLRNADGSGVLAGVTNISNVHGYVLSDGVKRADEGSLLYRGYELYDLLGDDVENRRFRYEEIAYLLLLGELPTQEQLDEFIEVIDEQRDLPEGFTASMITLGPRLIAVSTSLEPLPSMVGRKVPRPSSFTDWPCRMSSLRQLTMFMSTSTSIS